MATNKLTTKQIQILNLVYNFRFLNRIQIQTFLNHKSKYRINIWLKNLTNQGYLGRIYSKGYKDNSTPAIYYLRAKSIKVLAQSHAKVLVNQIYQDKYRSKRFIDKSMFIAEMYFTLRIWTDAHDQKLSLYTKTELIEGDFFSELKPSAFIEVRKKGYGKFRAMIEVFDEKTPRYALRYRLKQYDRFATYYFQSETKDEFMTAIFVCPDNFIKSYVEKYLKDEIDHGDPEYWLYSVVKTRSTVGQIKIG